MSVDTDLRSASSCSTTLIGHVKSSPAMSYMHALIFWSCSVWSCWGALQCMLELRMVRYFALWKCVSGLHWHQCKSAQKEGGAGDLGHMGRNESAFTPTLQSAQRYRVNLLVKPSPSSLHTQVLTLFTCSFFCSPVPRVQPCSVQDHVIDSVRIVHLKLFCVFVSRSCLILWSDLELQQMERSWIVRQEAFYNTV